MRIEAERNCIVATRVVFLRRAEHRKCIAFIFNGTHDQNNALIYQRIAAALTTIPTYEMPFGIMTIVTSKSVYNAKIDNHILKWMMEEQRIETIMLIVSSTQARWKDISDARVWLPRGDRIKDRKTSTKMETH